MLARRTKPIARQAILWPILASEAWPAIYWALSYWALLLSTIAWLYWPLLWGEVPAFRDAFHFYYPLEVWLASRADAGEFMPHFNPYDGTGSNLLGETSSGLCYPGRVLWWIPGLSVAQRFGVVLAFHTLVAAVGAAYAARRMNLSIAAGCLAATAYALGGAVLFQHVNPVYLIGAAWTPWLFAECWVLAHQVAPTSDRASKEAPSTSRHATAPRMGIWVAAAALMLLGGDPQATVNAGIVALLALATRLFMTGSWRFFARQLVWLTCAVLIVIGLTAVQWLPARHWLKHSQRAAAQPAADAPRDEQRADLPQLLLPLAAAPQPGSGENEIAQPRVGGMYGFSVAPWHLLTLIWGTAGGHFMPEHTRWLQRLGAEPRMWTASLSIGLLPVLWIIAAWSSRPARQAQRFLLVVIAVSGLAMLGNYAPAWLLRQTCHMIGADQWSRLLPSDEVGGMYWALSQIVPGYAAFRYPGKWSVWFACAMALAAADALDRRTEESRVLKRLCVIIAALSTAITLAFFLWPWLPAGGKLAALAFSNWLNASGSDAWLGRPEGGAVMQLWLQAATIAAAMGWVGAIALHLSHRHFRHRPQPVRALIVLLTLVELAWAGNMWVVAVDMRRIDASQIVPLDTNVADDRSLQAHSFERLWASTGRADFESWQDESPVGEQRPLAHAERVCAYQSVFRLGKLHLLSPRHANLSAIMSLTPRSLSAVRRVIAQSDDLRADNPPLDEALAWLGVTQRLVSGERLAWQEVSNARALAELIVAGQAGDAEADGDLSERTCIIEYMAADGLQVQVSSPRDARMIVRLLQDGGWSARIEPRGAAVGKRLAHRVVPASTHLGLFQTLHVPAGEWTIQLSYRAPGWRPGLTITLATLLVLLVLGLCRRFRHS